MSSFSYRQGTTGTIGARPYWVLSLSIVIRALHQLAGGVFLATFLLDGVAEPSSLYLMLASITGGALCFTEWLRHRQLFRELSGAVTMSKLVLLGGAYHGILPPQLTVTIAYLLASIGAHGPKNIRHRLLF